MSSANRFPRLVRLLALLLLAALGTALAEAQPRVPRRIDIGVTGGATLSSYDFKPTVVQDKARGYTFGLAARYVEEKFFALQAEALITRRGFRDRYERFPQYTFERDLTYLEVPVLAHIYFPLGRRSELALDLGPKFGAFLWDKTERVLPDDFAQPGTPTQNYRTEHHTMAVHNNFDYGIQAGLAYEFKASRHLSFQLAGRYYFGLGNIFPDEKSDTFETSSNQHVQITLTVWWKKYLHRN